MTPLLEFREVYKSYPGPDGGPPVEVLRGVDWRLEEGEAAVIVGPSGSGKSTLLNLAGALDIPTAGTVRLQGTDLTRADDATLAAVRRECVGFVFQQHLLMPHLTVLENVLLPLLADRRGPVPEEYARELLDRVGLTPRLHHRPAQLSGGEQQRVALARALVRRPALLLADEPTGSLDRTTAAAVASLLMELHTSLRFAMVVVTHSAELASRLPRQWTLHDGRLRPLA
ncbi:MAG: ABC transporter ATP-binding protein [Kiritimatiellae bacterium]|nr:ABC transporter ATP-binding protein [Kiritimatiellia bacterium]